MPRAEAVQAAETLLFWVQTYALIRVLVAALFLCVGIGRISPEAKGSYLFRLLILPGVVGLWPVVLWRWIELERERRAAGTGP